MKNRKIWSTLVCLVLVATALPSVSATATIGTLSTVEDNVAYVMVERNQTADDLSTLLGISLDEDDTLYVSYYNESTETEGTGGGTLTHTSFSPTQDSDDVVWFNLSITDMNLSKRQVYFDDETISDTNYNDAKEALYINASISDETRIYIITVPDGVTFEYEDNGILYDEDEKNFSILDEDGEEVGNLTSFNYSSTYNVYALNISDADSSHRLVVVDTEIQGTTTAATGSRIVEDSWIPYMDTLEPYTMEVETTSDYNIFSSEEGYVSFDIYNDYSGFFGKYIGGSTPFRMSATTLEYGSRETWTFWKTTWTEVTTDAASISDIDFGIIEYIYVEEASGSDEYDVIHKDNFGVITSIGSATTTTGIMNIARMWTTRTPEAVVNTDNLLFD